MSKLPFSIVFIHPLISLILGLHWPYVNHIQRFSDIIATYDLDWLYSHELYICDVFGRVELTSINGAFGKPPIILTFRRWTCGHLLNWQDPIFPNSPAWN